MEKFPDPTKLQMDIAERGRKMVTIIDPHIKRDDGYTIHKKAQDAGHYVKNEDGSTDFEGWCWPGSSSYFDFTSPKVMIYDFNFVSDPAREMMLTFDF